MAIGFIKVDLIDNLGSPWNISQNKIAPYAAWMKKKIKWTILFTDQKRKIINFLLKKKPSAIKHSPQSNVYYMEFNEIFYLNIV